MTGYSWLSVCHAGLTINIIYSSLLRPMQSKMKDLTFNCPLVYVTSPVWTGGSLACGHFPVCGAHSLISLISQCQSQRRSPLNHFRLDNNVLFLPAYAVLAVVHYVLFLPAYLLSVVSSQFKWFN